jgi:hypothetical protein
MNGSYISNHDDAVPTGPRSHVLIEAMVRKDRIVTIVFG